jgi:hypothetical protein
MPFAQHSEHILSVLISLASSLKVNLIVETTTDGTSPWKLLADILPFHAVTAKFDDFGIFVQRPFGLLLGRRLW